MAAELYVLRGVEMAHEWTGPVTKKKSDEITWYQAINLQLFIFTFNQK